MENPRSSPTAVSTISAAIGKPSQVGTGYRFFVRSAAGLRSTHADLGSRFAGKAGSRRRVAYLGDSLTSMPSERRPTVPELGFKTWHIPGVEGRHVCVG